MKILVSTSAIPLSVYRTWGAGKKWDRSSYDALFKRFSGEKSRYRLYIPMQEVIPAIQHVSIPAKIVEKVEQAGYYVDDYLAGIAVDKKSGKRKIRIGRLLNDSLELKAEFDNDPQRQASKLAKASQFIVISRHPYDLAGASYDRGWKSCLHLTDGLHRRYLAEDVKHGTLIAYLVHTDDKNINHPTARVRILRFSQEGGTPADYILVPEDNIYGSAPATFLESVRNWCKVVNKGREEGIYCAPDVYVDSEGGDTRLHVTSLQGALKIAETARKDGDQLEIEQIFPSLEREDSIQFLQKVLYVTPSVGFDSCLCKLKPEELASVCLLPAYKHSPVPWPMLAMYDQGKYSIQKLRALYAKITYYRYLNGVFDAASPTLLKPTTLLAHYKLCSALFNSDSNRFIESLNVEPTALKAAISAYSTYYKSHKKNASYLANVVTNISDRFRLQAVTQILHNVGLLPDTAKSYLTIQVPELAKELGIERPIAAILAEAQAGNTSYRLNRTLLTGEHGVALLTALTAAGARNIFKGLRMREAASPTAQIFTILADNFSAIRKGAQAEILNSIAYSISKYLVGERPIFDALFVLIKKTKSTARLKLLASIVRQADRVPEDRREVILEATAGIERDIIKAIISSRPL